MDGMSPKIAMLAASHDTQNALRAWAERAGFDLTRAWGDRVITSDQFDFHVTLLATKNPVFIPETDHQIEPIEVEPIGFAALGPDADTPVLSLDASGALALAREFFVETYGAEPTFEDFKPHISLSYNWNGDPALDQDEFELPDFPLTFDRLIVKPFEPEQKALIISQRRTVPGAHGLYK